MTERTTLPGAAKDVLAPNVILLKADEQLFAEMLRGWTIQQQSRGLKTETIESRLAVMRRFATYTNAFPWQWTPVDVEEWTTLLVSERHLAHSSIRGIHNALQLFMEYLIDPRYGWAAECDERFGQVPVQICHEWNTIEHLAEFEGRPGNRPLTREELQAFFDEADSRVAAARKAHRKGALAAFRDSVMLKTAYGWGLRRREVVMLELADFGRSPAAPEFGRYGYIHVRYGKALRGSPPRRRTVLTTMPWAVEALTEYLEDVRPLFGFEGLATLWPTERGSRVHPRHIEEQFASIRDALGLPRELGPHCLRHSYVTHLIEDGWDPRFVQEQVGHAFASTTAIYTGVSNDFKNRVLREALDDLYGLTAPESKERRR